MGSITNPILLLFVIGTIIITSLNLIYRVIQNNVLTIKCCIKYMGCVINLAVNPNLSCESHCHTSTSYVVTVGLCSINNCLYKTSQRVYILFLFMLCVLA